MARIPASKPVTLKPIGTDLVESARRANDDVIESAMKASEEVAGGNFAEFGETVRTTFEQGIAQTRAAYEKAKEAAEHNVTAVETSFETVKAGVAALNEKSLDVVKSFFDAQVAFAKAALGAKTIADIAALQGEFGRKQVEFFGASVKDFGAHAQKVAVEAIEPIKARVEAAFEIAA